MLCVTPPSGQSLSPVVVVNAPLVGLGRKNPATGPFVAETVIVSVTFWPAVIVDASVVSVTFGALPPP
jgi:hypothetical protein